jgi:Chaperone of endosialidase
MTPMKTLMKKLILGPLLRPYCILTAIALGLLALSPGMQAVIPAPDGGYPGGNTAEGQNALLSLTSGTFNTAVGLSSLQSDTVGSFNTATGVDALLLNTGNQNTATGAGALLSNSTGSSNTANGAFALLSNITGLNNTANGGAALYNNTTGSDNTANGVRALFSNTTGGDNTATGSGALFNNTTGQFNTANGDSALGFNTNGSGNTANGASALENNTRGGNNTATGEFALASNTTGSNNIALGLYAGSNLTSGDNNIYLGSVGVAMESNTIRLGTSGTQDRAFIRGIRGVTTGNNDAIPVQIDTAGQLGTTSSSRRFKKEIKPMENASEAILALKPVTFHYKSDKANTPQFGLIAEEVAEVNPDLVVRDENGEIYTVRYDAVNAMLLNEFLKEHRKVEEQSRKIQEQEATIAELRSDAAYERTTISGLKNGMEAVIGHLKEQDSKIQKVSNQIEINKAGPGVVRNDPGKVESQ